VVSAAHQSGPIKHPLEWVFASLEGQHPLERVSASLEGSHPLERVSASLEGSLTGAPAPARGYGHLML
jgi:hypothetical protein